MIHRSPRPDVVIPQGPLHAVVMARFEEFGDRPAIIEGTTGRQIGYRQLGRDIEHVAANLAARGFGRGDVLAICLPNVPEYAAAFLGASRAGGTVTTMNPLYTEREIGHQLQETGARFLVTVAPLAARCLDAARDSRVECVFCLGEAPGTVAFETLLQEAPPLAAVAIDPAEDLAALPYSSGTSGVSRCLTCAIS